ncbi:MAG TPA: hypothetical protein VG013_20890 [Gemmataceae bacterium]|nr:hypothetical protein [Gemmataceae bacterium]
MAVYRKKAIESQTLILDGNEYVDCELKDCNLIYKAHEPVKLEHCRLIGCSWEFEDAALRTISLLKGLWLSGHNGKEIVEAIFKNV